MARKDGGKNMAGRRDATRSQAAEETPENVRQHGRRNERASGAGKTRRRGPYRQRTEITGEDPLDVPGSMERLVSLGSSNVGDRMDEVRQGPEIRTWEDIFHFWQRHHEERRAQDGPTRKRARGATGG